MPKIIEKSSGVSLNLNIDATLVPAFVLQKTEGNADWVNLLKNSGLPLELNKKKFRTNLRENAISSNEWTAKVEDSDNNSMDSKALAYFKSNAKGVRIGDVVIFGVKNLDNKVSIQGVINLKKLGEVVKASAGEKVRK